MWQNCCARACQSMSRNQLFPPLRHLSNFELAITQSRRQFETLQRVKRSQAQLTMRLPSKLYIPSTIKSMLIRVANVVAIHDDLLME